MKGSLVLALRWRKRETGRANGRKRNSLVANLQAMDTVSTAASTSIKTRTRTAQTPSKSNVSEIVRPVICIDATFSLVSYPARGHLQVRHVNERSVWALCYFVSVYVRGVMKVRTSPYSSAPATLSGHPLHHLGGGGQRRDSDSQDWFCRAGLGPEASNWKVWSGPSLTIDPFEASFRTEAEPEL